MSTYVNVSLDVLNWVSTQINMSTISDRFRDDFMAWIKGKKKPTFKQLKEISRATGIPFGYFFMKTPPQEDLSFVKYRTINSVGASNPSRNLIDTMHDMKMVQDWMHRYLIKEDSLPVNYLRSINANLSYEEAAQKVREVLQLSTDWYTDSKNADESFKIIRQAISDARTLVMMSGIVGSNTHRSLAIEEFRAFCIVDEYAPLIFINSNDSVNGKLFSLLHEFSHICLGENSLFNDRYGSELEEKKEEAICNAVAAEILVPRLAFLAEWNKLHDNYATINEKVDKLAHVFKCGNTVIARRAYDNKLIKRSQYTEIAQLAVRNYVASRKNSKGNGGSFYNTLLSRLDRHFSQALIGSVKEGHTLYTEAFRLTHTNSASFDVFMNKIEESK